MPENDDNRAARWASSLAKPATLDLSSVTASIALHADAARMFKELEAVKSPVKEAAHQFQAALSTRSVGVTSTESAATALRMSSARDLAGPLTGLRAAADRMALHQSSAAAALQVLAVRPAGLFDVVEARSAALTNLRTALIDVAPRFRMEDSMGASTFRLSALQLGFQQSLGGRADAFGRLDRAVRDIPSLAGAVDELVIAVRTRGALGFDRRGVEVALGRVDDLLADPAVEGAVAEPIEAVQELTRTSETVLRLPDAIGAMRSFRVSTTGLFCGFTAGLLYFVMNVANGSPGEVEVINAIVDGAGIYGLVHGATAGNDG